MAKNVTELVFILDKSGSMHGLELDTLGGFNSMVEKQKKEEGEAFVTTVLFSTDRLRIHDRIPISRVPELTSQEYQPGGCTALLDAMGDTIRHIAQIHRYIRPEDVPDRTLFVIITDGLENASRRYSPAEVKRLVEHEKSKYGWEFLFLGANIDAVTSAADIGIAEDRAVTYRGDSAGTSLNFQVVEEQISSLRQGRGVDPEWKSRIEDYANEE